jgi:ssDNA-binding Zn-finger/Zn-ribbon topoisomerase 1
MNEAIKNLESLAEAIELESGSSVDQCGLNGTKYVHESEVFGKKVPVITICNEDGDGVIVGYINDRYVWGCTDFSRGHETWVLGDKTHNWKSDDCPECNDILELL